MICYSVARPLSLARLPSSILRCRLNHGLIIDAMTVLVIPFVESGTQLATIPGTISYYC